MTTCKFLDIDQQSVNTIRTLAMDAIQKANSGHPGGTEIFLQLKKSASSKHFRVC